MRVMCCSLRPDCAWGFEGQPVQRRTCREQAGTHLDGEGEYETDELAHFVVAVRRVVLSDELKVGGEERRRGRVEDVPATGSR